jgi:hypothetical protein
MNVPILQYSPDQGDEQLLSHQMTDDENALFSELDAASAAVESDELDAIYQVIVPLGAAHGLSANETIAFWTRSTFSMFEAPEFSPTSGPDEPPVEFNGLMFMALDHGFDSIKDGNGPLIPFAIVHTTCGERRLQRFVTDRIEQGVERAKEYIAEHASDFSMYAIVWDGYITMDDTKWDAVLVEAGMADRDEGFMLCQRYQYKKTLFRKRNIPVGNPAFVGNPPSRVHRMGEPNQ